MIAPAKINLFLEVLGPRGDGFHEVETVLQAVSLFDLVRVTLAERFAFACSDPTLPAGEDNLAVRALRAYERAVGRSVPVRIDLEKRIPAGAGLGGASSDAAAVLRALDRLEDDLLGGEALLDLGAGLGSDVPFFLLGSPAALGRGRGEVLTPIDPGAPRPVLLIVPRLSISTAEAYRLLGPVAGRPRLREDGPFNRFEEVVFARWPELAALRDRLAAHGVGPVRLSGSGSTLFAMPSGAEEGVAWRGAVAGWPDAPRVELVHTLASCP